MSTVDLRDLHKIPQSRKDTVSGYIRRNKSSTHQQIPQGVVFICILFYGTDCDEFDPKWKGKTMILSKNNRCVDYQPTGPQNIYGKKIIDSGYHEWKFKIIKSGSEGPFFMIGLWRCSTKKNPPTTGFFTRGQDQGYGYSVGTAAKSRCSDGCTMDSFGVKVNDGDIVEMMVDFDQLSLCWKVNGESYGKSHDITKDKYRAAVFIGLERRIVEIIE